MALGHQRVTQAIVLEVCRDLHLTANTELPSIDTTGRGAIRAAGLTAADRCARSAAHGPSWAALAGFSPNEPNRRSAENLREGKRHGGVRGRCRSARSFLSVEPVRTRRAGSASSRRAGGSSPRLSRSEPFRPVSTARPIAMQGIKLPEDADLQARLVTGTSSAVSLEQYRRLGSGVA